MATVFDDIDTKVAGYNPLTAEEARRLYARYVKRGLDSDYYRRVLERIADPTPAMGRPPFSADDLRTIAREALTSFSHEVRQP